MLGLSALASMIVAGVLGYFNVPFWWVFLLIALAFGTLTNSGK
jgi:membrane glycosyltransferase